MASLQFKTAKTRKKENRRKTFAVLAVLLVIVIVASIVTFFKEREVEDVDEPTTEEITLAAGNELQEEINLLVSGVTTSENTVEFLFVVHFNTVDGSMSVVGVKAPNGVDASKPIDLVAAVEKSSGVDIDRYVILNQKKFKAFIKSLGSYEVNLKENINYSSDEYSVNLLKGKQTLAGEKFYNYLRYLYEGGSDYALQNVALVVVDYISQNFNEDTTAQGQDLFEDLVNSCETDITILDYSKYENFLAEISADLKIDATKLDDLEKDR